VRGGQVELKDICKVYYLEKLPFKIWDHDLKQNSAELDLQMIEIVSILTFIGGGIYRMYNDAGEIVYVGKSNDIQRRLLQHVGKRTNSHYFIDEVVKIEYHVNNDPVFQTMLEGLFIAYHSPKYNDEVKERIGGKNNA
jgi:DNA polymerase III subunit epsilon